MKDNLLIIGTSKTAEYLYEFIQYHDLFDIIGFAVDKEYISSETFCGLPVYAIEDIDNIIDKEKDYIFVAMLWNRLNADRRDMYNRLKALGYKFANIISPTSIVRNKQIGDNCWFHDYSIIQHGAIIGNDVQILSHTLIGPHTEIGDHCICNTQSTVAGNCKIGEQTYVGINATVFDDTTVGRKCIVGACAVVKRNLGDFSVCKTQSNNMVIKYYGEDIVESKLMFKRNVR